MTATVPPEAITAAAEALARAAHEPLPPGSFYRARARVALEAAAPLIADDAIADARYEGRIDGEKVGAAAERNRIRQLAVDHSAQYRDADAPGGWKWRSFADLLRGAP